MKQSIRPVRLVTFDLYDTLIEMTPPRWERLATVCAMFGVAADVTVLRAADLIAEDYYTEENTITPIRDRTPTEREAFRLRYMAKWLEAAGISHDEVTVRRFRQAYVAEFEGIGSNYRVFPDVMPTLARLRGAGIKTAVISNADDDVTDLCTHLAFAHEMDAIITSAIVGWEKPDPRTFQAALDAVAVNAENALHIGDQPRSDVVGALDVGMQAALIDRYERHAAGAYGVPHVRDLAELAEFVLRDRAVAGT